MAELNRITIDPAILSGKPIVRGTRISVELVIDLLASGWNPLQILENYPTLQPGDVEACLKYASALLHEECVYPLKTA
ncbi:MAG: DUF433 domain-containing protein [Bryobacterales bacterium]|nr:DUF433 domain-containing protein [Bryobacterales bacterium]